MRYEAGAVLYNGRKNVLWGAGERGFQTLLLLCGLGIYIDLVCDSDRQKEGLRFFNKKVVSPERVLNGEYNYNFIIAVEKEEYIREIADRLRQAGRDNFVLWRDLDVGGYSVDLEREQLYWMIRDAYSRRLAIYGADEEGRRLGRILKLLDVEAAFYLEDVEEEYEDRGGVVKPVYDLLYEDWESVKVIVMKNKRSRTAVLEQMGLQERVDYNYCGEYMPNRAAGKLYILDPNLGYSFFGRGPLKKPGFVEMGEEGCTIVLLGGSTTDGVAYPFRSWGELLYEEFCRNGYKVRILNGGCAGYKSSQELIKLVRDVVPMKPDLVIDYTGFNDANNCSEEYVFVHSYQKELLDSIAGTSEEGGAEQGHYSRGDYTLGVRDCRPTWEVFAGHIGMMEAVCSRQHIRYLPFLQPSLPTKGRRGVCERELILNTLPSNYMAFLDGLLAEFHENLKRMEEVCLEDLTGLLDDCEGVYLDICHVTEKGNERIARYLYEYLTGKGFVKK